MYFALTDEQRALAETVRDFLADRFDLTAVRAVFEDTAGDGHPAELWKAFAEQGWLAVLVPEENDGMGLGLLDAQVLARAFGAGAVPGPWLPTVLAGEAVRLAGSPAQRAAVLGPLAAGELVATVALRAPGGSFDQSGVGVTADIDPGGTRLTGTASPVEYAGVARTAVVAAKEPDGGIGLYLVDPTSASVTVTALDTYDGTTRLGALTLDGAAGERLPESNAAVLAELSRRGAVLAAADLVGTARAALTRTIEYDKTRVQFGKAVGSFQFIKHTLADLHVGVLMAEHAALYAAHAVDAALPDAALAVAVAKAKANDAAERATGAMIQYHGGIGYTWEHEAHFFYKRAKRLVGTFGDAGEHLDRIAALSIDA
ncbi:acyl-CoA dehydrogenase family protein [Pseudofrankia sp. BMG5.37]|uniref:acyl-CoA dehydrogenase family protein n=1 Tax=Pseudofrankia sp. BMG5.37 TaxID=3050035 RepID=UPI0028948C4D|nr:acyl-CoA dehydrogenase family protein [Pseudofrankia sp. BMG5.37]MDT3440061.1 acyl-CoA dehydrogenase family protein [Pseudofrankia sp. BMG5.37]